MMATLCRKQLSSNVLKHGETFLALFMPRFCLPKKKSQAFFSDEIEIVAINEAILLITSYCERDGCAYVLLVLCDLL